MENSLFSRIPKQVSCLIGIIISLTVIGIVFGMLSVIVVQKIQELPPTLTPMPCLIGLDVKHDLHDTLEAYALNHLPIGEIEIGVYAVVAITDELVAIDWRGSLPYPPPFQLLDWIAPVNGVDEVYGDCSRVINLITATPTPVG